MPKQPTRGRNINWGLRARGAAFIDRLMLFGNNLHLHKLGTIKFVLLKMICNSP